MFYQLIRVGLLLGPSLLRAFFPGFGRGLFRPSTSTIFTGLTQKGLRGRSPTGRDAPKGPVGFLSGFVRTAISR